MFKRYFVALCFGLAVTPVYAEDTRTNLANLQVEVSGALPNDVLNAALYIEDTDANPGKLAERVNATLNAAMAKAKGYAGVNVATGALQTYPIYSDKNKLTGWRTRATIALDSKDFASAQKLLGELQGRLQIENISFSVSPELRTKQENELIGQAFSAFRERAQLVQLGLHGKSWKVVNITLSNAANDMRPIAYRANVMMAEAAPAPELSSGTSEIKLQIMGTIQVSE